MENVGPNSGRVSTGQFPSSIDGPPSGNENFVYRVLANYSADRRYKPKGGCCRGFYTRKSAGRAVNCNP